MLGRRPSWGKGGWAKGVGSIPLLSHGEDWELYLGLLRQPEDAAGVGHTSNSRDNGCTRGLRGRGTEGKARSGHMAVVVSTLALAFGICRRTHSAESLKNWETETQGLCVRHPDGMDKAVDERPRGATRDTLPRFSGNLGNWKDGAHRKR